VQRGNKSIKLTVSAQIVTQDLKLGDSIAVNGICLTVVQHGENWFAADVMPETMAKTALVGIKAGDRVNLERALRLGDRLGGHIVSGHIDGLGIIESKTKDANAIIIKVSTTPEILRYVVVKGSIAIDGISLTVVDVGPNWFTVSLIPHTAIVTTLGLKQPGDPVNLEADILGKYVEKLLTTDAVPHRERPVQSRLSSDFLAMHGFI